MQGRGCGWQNQKSRRENRGQFFPDLRLFTIDGACVYQALQASCLSTTVMKEEFARKLDPDEAAALRNDYPDVVESGEMEKILSWFPQAFQQKAEEEHRE